MQNPKTIVNESTEKCKAFYQAQMHLLRIIARQNAAAFL